MARQCVSEDLKRKTSALTLNSYETAKLNELARWNGVSTSEFLRDYIQSSYTKMIDERLQRHIEIEKLITLRAENDRLHPKETLVNRDRRSDQFYQLIQNHEDFNALASVQIYT